MSHRQKGDSQNTTSAQGSAQRAQTTSGGGKERFEEQKAQARQRKRLEKAVNDAEQNVAQLEQAIAILEARMSSAEGASEPSIFEKYSRLKQQLSQAEDEWTQAMEALEANETT